MEFDLKSIDRLLTTTRAVRRRLDLQRPVPRHLIEECLELALQAPTGGNSQGWRWLIVDDPDHRAALADICRRCEGGRFNRSKAAAQAAGNAQTARVYDSAAYLMDHLHEVPVHVIPCLHPRPPADTAGPRWAATMGSIYPAVWSFQLALRSRGLGSVLTTVHLFDEPAVAKLLGIPDDVMQVALLPVGWTLGGDFKPARRRPLAEVSHWNAWQD